MILLDTNIFIYLSKGILAPDTVKNIDIAHAGITKIEALGFTTMPAQELLLLEELFAESYDLELTAAIVESAIKLRQKKRMSLGDSIIGATAIVNELALWTANIDDFAHLDGLELLNPLDKRPPRI